jgi:hypothetical protein
LFSFCFLFFSLLAESLFLCQERVRVAGASTLERAAAAEVLEQERERAEVLGQERVPAEPAEDGISETQAQEEVKKKQIFQYFFFINGD